MTNRILTLALAAGAVTAGSATVALAHGGNGGGSTSATPIATVESYTGGVLTLKTTGGTEVSGKVTRRTSIDCRSAVVATTPTATPTTTATPDATTPDDSANPGRSGGGDDRGGRGPGGGGDQGGGGRGQRMQASDDDSGDDEPVCDTTSLTAGTSVRSATTTLTASGQKFTRLLLVTSDS